MAFVPLLPRARARRGHGDLAGQPSRALGHRARGWPLLRAHVRGDGRLPPLLLAPHVQDVARVAVRARAPRHLELAEGRHLVGRASPRSPPQVRDLTGDVHSAKIDGFWWSHVGWILSTKYEDTDEHGVKDFDEVPRAPLARPMVPRSAVRARRRHVARRRLVGAHVGFFVSTTLLWHGTFTINSLTHVFGKRRYDTTDNSQEPLAPRAHHDGRGLAQQPPLLHELDAPRLLLVGEST